MQKKLYDFIVKRCGGKMSHIKGIDRTTLNNMKEGKSNITFKTFCKICKENGFESQLTISINGESLTLKLGTDE